MREKKPSDLKNRQSFDRIIRVIDSKSRSVLERGLRTERSELVDTQTLKKTSTMMTGASESVSISPKKVSKTRVKKSVMSLRTYGPEQSGGGGSFFRNEGPRGYLSQFRVQMHDALQTLGALMDSAAGQTKFPTSDYFSKVFRCYKGMVNEESCYSPLMRQLVDCFHRGIFFTSQARDAKRPQIIAINDERLNSFMLLEVGGEREISHFEALSHTLDCYQKSSKKSKEEITLLRSAVEERNRHIAGLVEEIELRDSSVLGAENYRDAKALLEVLFG